MGRESQKLGKFYNFQITETRFAKVSQKGQQLVLRHFRNSLIFGFLIEALIVQSKICTCFSLFVNSSDENIVKNTTLKRLGTNPTTATY